MPECTPSRNGCQGGRGVNWHFELTELDKEQLSGSSQVDSHVILQLSCAQVVPLC
jgi:hypothetical protein